MKRQCSDIHGHPRGWLAVSRSSELGGEEKWVEVRKEGSSALFLEAQRLMGNWTHGGRARV